MGNYFLIKQRIYLYKMTRTNSRKNLPQKYVVNLNGYMYRWHNKFLPSAMKNRPNRAKIFANRIFCIGTNLNVLFGAFFINRMSSGAVRRKVFWWTVRYFSAVSGRVYSPLPNNTNVRYF